LLWYQVTHVLAIETIVTNVKEFGRQLRVVLGQTPLDAAEAFDLIPNHDPDD